jgi:riboflavin synthase
MNLNDMIDIRNFLRTQGLTDRDNEQVESRFIQNVINLSSSLRARETEAHANFSHKRTRAMFASTSAASTSSYSSPSSSLTFRRSHQKQSRTSLLPHQQKRRHHQKRDTTTRALFTGIVQGTATVTTFTPIQGEFARLTLTFPENTLENLTIGASIAVNGTCLTVVEFDVEKSTASFDMIAETLRATNLGELQVSDVVNYERSTKFGEEIGGHVVSGHVHTTAEIYAQEETENNREVRFRLRDREIVKYILPKGFVAVDGCSLTVGDVDEKEGTFNVWLIPETIRATAFRVKSVGASVNIEIESSTRAIVDTIERYMERREKEKTG